MGDTPKPWTPPNLEYMISPVTKLDEAIREFEVLVANMRLKERLGDEMDGCYSHYRNAFQGALEEGLELPERFDPDTVIPGV
jgi:hypothetical protein